MIADDFSETDWNYAHRRQHNSFLYACCRLLIVACQSCNEHKYLSGGIVSYYLAALVPFCTYSSVNQALPSPYGCVSTSSQERTNYLAVEEYCSYRQRILLAYKQAATLPLCETDSSLVVYHIDLLSLCIRNPRGSWFPSGCGTGKFKRGNKTRCPLLKYF